MQITKKEMDFLFFKTADQMLLCLKSKPPLTKKSILDILHQLIGACCYYEAKEIQLHAKKLYYFLKNFSDLLIQETDLSKEEFKELQHSLESWICEYKDFI